MQIFINVITTVAGIWLILSSFILNTRNFKSVLFFKVIPFFIGIGCLFASGKLFGLI